MFNHNFTDFAEKAGFKRNRPRTKVTFAATISIVNPMLINKEMKAVCGLRIVVIAVIAVAIGTANSQPCCNLALI